ncbi:SCO1431 family membrane protein [Streptomyces sp. Ru73]|uniref:SCO1431 family membrane protein n=1 Tax=Streptomyces sp. Ru73 TaxID=2080748 RepID=UPI000CDE38CF|nr:SCO1431 family membrane protein [Streptomyces sp. Ru73]
MPAEAAAAALDAPAARTGGPKDDNPWMEHVLGWTLVVVLAMFLTQTGLLTGLF